MFVGQFFENPCEVLFIHAFEYLPPPSLASLRSGSKYFSACLGSGSWGLGTPGVNDYFKL